MTRFRRVGSEGRWPIHAVETGSAAYQALRDVQAGGMSDAVRGFALSTAMFTFIDSKLLPIVEEHGCVASREAAERCGYDPNLTAGLLRFLATQGLFAEEAGEVFRLTPQGAAAIAPTSISTIRFYVGGYGHLMTASGRMLERTVTYGRDITRDVNNVVIGSMLNTASFMDMVPLAVLARRGCLSVADLGCGAGQFLIEWVKGGPERRGVGIDLAPEAIAAAKASADKHGVASQLSFHVGDAFDLALVKPACRDIDALFSFAMEHEALRDGEVAVTAHIDAMAAQFPGKRYLLGEPMLEMSAADGVFYWLHVLSMQGIPRDVPGWCSLLDRLKTARLNEVFIPDHRSWCAYFDIEFPVRSQQ